MEFLVSGAVNDADEQVCDYENSCEYVGAGHGVLLKSDSPGDGQNDSILSCLGVQNPREDARPSERDDQGKIKKPHT